jgi:hypothetical protein
MDLGGGPKVLGLIMLRATRRPHKDFLEQFAAQNRENHSLYRTEGCEGGGGVVYILE